MRRQGQLILLAVGAKLINLKQYKDMKKIKLMIVGVILVAGLLESLGMGVDKALNDQFTANLKWAKKVGKEKKQMREEQRELGEDLTDAQFREIVGSLTVEELMEKIQERIKTHEGLKAFIGHMSPEKPLEVAVLREFLDDNEDTRISEFNEAQRKEFKTLLSEIFPAMKRLKVKMEEASVSVRDKVMGKKDRDDTE